MWDEYDLSRSSSGKHSRRTSHSAVSFRAVIRESLAGLLRNDPSSWDRIRLFATVPELHARFLDEQTRSIEQVARLLKTKRGRRVDDLILQVVGSALLAAVAVALERWQKDEGKSDLLALLDQATNALAEGIRELRRSEASPPAGAARARPSRPTRDRRSPERKRGA
jgi:MftR C-terminal domain